MIVHTPDTAAEQVFVPRCLALATSNNSIGSIPELRLNNGKIGSQDANPLLDGLCFASVGLAIEAQVRKAIAKIAEKYGSHSGATS